VEWEKVKGRSTSAESTNEKVFLMIIVVFVMKISIPAHVYWWQCSTPSQLTYNSNILTIQKLMRYNILK